MDIQACQYSPVMMNTSVALILGYYTGRYVFCASPAPFFPADYVT